MKSLRIQDSSIIRRYGEQDSTSSSNKDVLAVRIHNHYSASIFLFVIFTHFLNFSHKYVFSVLICHFWYEFDVD